MEKNELIEFKNSKEWIEFDKYYNYTSFMKRVGFYKYEDPNTNFLASILNETFDGTYYALRLLIELISKKDKVFDDVDLISEYKIDAIDIKPRKTINKIKPDLLIKFKINSIKYVIVIEAKLSSEEGPDQCQKYEKIIKEEYPSSKKIFLFLDSNASTKISGDYIRITYSDLLENIYTPCSFKLNNSELLSQLEEYIKSFIEFYKYDNISIKNMPLSYEGKMLTMNLWNYHSDLIVKIFSDRNILKKFYDANTNSVNALMINTLKLEDSIHIDDSIKSNMISLLNKSNARNKFIDGEKYNNVDFVYKIFKEITTNSELKIKNIADIPDNVLMTTRDWKNIMSETEYKTSPRKNYYYLSKKGNEPIIINGEKYYCCNSYTGQEIEKLISSILEVYPIYKDKIGRNFKL